MSDTQESIEQEVDLQALAGAKQDQKQEQQEEAQLSSTEQKAWDQGWRPEDDFNGPSDNWKTAKEYIRDGEFISQINSLKNDMNKQKDDFDSRLNNNNKLHEARRKADINKLKAQQRDAVDMSDTDAFDKAQTQIDALEEQQVVEPTSSHDTGKDPAIVAWEAKNPWFNDLGDERGAVAVGVWNTFTNKNPAATIQQALAHVDSRMDNIYPSNSNNARRNQPNTTENNTRRSSRQSKSLTMNDLTSSERSEWNMFGSTMFTEEQFLKTVLDTRTK